MLVDANWVGGIIGGCMIGAAASLLLLFNGRISGVSGIVGQLFFSRLNSSNAWRLFFVIGLIAGAWVYSFSINGLIVQMEVQGLPLVAAGLLVGIGTKLGSGCTSGHGVCGIGRRSARSIVATLVFVSVAVATASIIGSLN